MLFRHHSRQAEERKLMSRWNDQVVQLLSFDNRPLISLDYWIKARTGLVRSLVMF